MKKKLKKDLALIATMTLISLTYFIIYSSNLELWLKGVTSVLGISFVTLLGFINISIIESEES